MTSRTRALAFLLASSALAGCASPPEVRLQIREGETKISELARLVLIVRECGVNTLGAKTDLLELDAPSVSLEAAVAPGETFYVRLEGWRFCEAPPGTCIPESEADVRQCACMPDGTTQELFSQACTSWLAAHDGSPTALTLREIPPDTTEGVCAPPKLEDCAVLGAN